MRKRSKASLAILCLVGALAVRPVFADDNCKPNLVPVVSGLALYSAAMTGLCAFLLYKSYQFLNGMKIRF